MSLQVLTKGHNKLANSFIDFKDFKDFIVHLDIFPGLYSVSPIFALIVYFSTLKDIVCQKASYSIL